MKKLILLLTSLILVTTMMITPDVSAASNQSKKEKDAVEKMKKSMNDAINLYERYINTNDDKYLDALEKKVKNFPNLVPSGISKDSPLHMLHFLQKKTELQLAVSALENSVSVLAPYPELAEYHADNTMDELHTALEYIKKFNDLAKKYGVSKVKDNIKIGQYNIHLDI